MKNMTLDGLIDDLLTCTDADFELRNVCTKREAQAYLDSGTLPNGWQKPRSVLFRFAAALAIQAFVTPDCAPEGTYHAHDHDADYPSLCEVCGASAMVGNYCSERCRKIQEGELSHAEQMADL